MSYDLDKYNTREYQEFLITFVIAWNGARIIRNWCAVPRVGDEVILVEDAVRYYVRIERVVWVDQLTPIKPAVTVHCLLVSNHDFS